MKILLAAVVLPAFFALPLYAANVPLSIRLAEAKGEVSAEAGLLGRPSLPPGAKAPEEPRVQAPPPPPATDAGTTDAPPEALPATETAAPVPPSPAQEREAADSTVSPSAP